MIEETIGEMTEGMIEEMTGGMEGGTIGEMTGGTVLLDDDNSSER